MPIDTAEKRRSAAGTGFHPLGPGVTPNVLTPVGWRQQSGWGYSGVVAGSPAAEKIGYIEGVLTLIPTIRGTGTLQPVIRGSVELN